MKNKIIILFIIIKFNFCLSQNNINNIIYEVKFSEINQYENTPLKNDYERMLTFKNNNSFNLTLLNDSIAHFKIDEKLKSDFNDKSFRLFKVFCGYTGEIFTDLKNKKNFINQNNQIGNFYVEKDLKKYEWEITNESKIIQNYKCYKAIGSEKIQNPVGVFYNKIEVWFAPEIPLQIGPLGFSGLPGLILELNRKGVTFGAIKLLRKESTEIGDAFPSKEQIISEEKLKSMRDKFLEN